MKAIIKMIILLLVNFSLAFGQFNIESIDDISNNAPVDPNYPAYKVESINLTGNFHELVVAVGFPDRNPSYPTLNTNSYYPKLGAFRDGTLLKDYIVQNGGSIPVDQWYEPAFDYYFTQQSGGQYTVDFTFPKATGGTPFLAHNLESYGQGQVNNIIYENWQNILNDVAANMYESDNTIFNNVDVIHFFFNVGTTSKNEFWKNHGGTVNWGVTLQDENHIYFENKPISLNWKASSLVHERMHIIGTISGKPDGFRGFPDRGNDILANPVGNSSHHNLTGVYEVMNHDGIALPSLHSLFALPPIAPYDLIFLGWIHQDEIKVVNGNNMSNIKLVDVSYPLSVSQKSNGFYRVAKVMIHENFDGDYDEYFLIVFHNGTEFDKFFSNYTEFNSTYNINKGISVWHVKERVNMTNLFSDNAYDLEVATPYNNWNLNSSPNDSYPRNNYRPLNNPEPYWNGNEATDFDYLDDYYMDPNWDYPQDEFDENVFRYIPDGGDNFWEYTVPYSSFGWYKPAPEWFYRAQSKRNDFFTDEVINGYVNDKLSNSTRPSTRDWEGMLTNITIKNIKHVNNYMSIDVAFDDYDGPFPAPPNLKISYSNGHPKLTWLPHQYKDFGYYRIYKGTSENNVTLYDVSATNKISFKVPLALPVDSVSEEQLKEQDEKLKEKRRKQSEAIRRHNNGRNSWMGV